MSAVKADYAIKQLVSKPGYAEGSRDLSLDADDLNPLSAMSAMSTIKTRSDSGDGRRQECELRVNDTAWKEIYTMRVMQLLHPVMKVSKKHFQAGEKY